jgi:hypothetical protein
MGKKLVGAGSGSEADGRSQSEVSDQSRVYE